MDTEVQKSFVVNTSKNYYLVSWLHQGVKENFFKLKNAGPWFYIDKIDLRERGKDYAEERIVAEVKCSERRKKWLD